MPPMARPEHESPHATWLPNHRCRRCQRPSQNAARFFRIAYPRRAQTRLQLVVEVARILMVAMGKPSGSDCNDCNSHSRRKGCLCGSKSKDKRPWRFRLSELPARQRNPGFREDLPSSSRFAWNNTSCYEFQLDSYAMQTVKTQIHWRVSLGGCSSRLDCRAHAQGLGVRYRRMQEVIETHRRFTRRCD